MGRRWVPLVVSAVMLCVVVVVASLAEPSPLIGRGGENPSRQTAISPLSRTVIPVGSYPFGITFDPINDWVYVTDFGSNNVTVINSTDNRVIGSVPMPYGIESIVADTNTGRVYTGAGGYSVYAITGTAVSSTISLTSAGCPNGCWPAVEAYDSGDGTIYVTDAIDNNVSVISGTEAISAIPVGTWPNGATYDSSNGDIYVSNEGSSNLSVINGATERVVASIADVGPGSGLAYDRSNGDIYVCSNYIQRNQTNNVTVVNGSSNHVVTRIPVGTDSEGAIYDPANGFLYITDRSRPGGVFLSNVTVIDPQSNTVLWNIPVQSGPIGITYDSSNHDVYVADSNTDNVSVIPPIVPVSFRETGLPTGTNWSVALDSTSGASTNTTILLAGSNGTLSYSVPSVSVSGTVFNANPSVGTVNVAGEPLTVNVVFSNSSVQPRPQTGHGFGNVVPVLIITTGAALGALVAIVVLYRRRRSRSGSE